MTVTPAKRESFTDQRRRVATAEDCNARWGGAKHGKRFRCYLCGYRFQPGDGWRWQYASGRNFTTAKGSRFGVFNFLVCDGCDGEDVLDRWVERNREFHSVKFWALQ